ncbi:hypothetical protein L1887_32125 [Cichorium endivia]|nr:hypothetical protein L1887_32125 [Cichorium endivia]
MANMEKGEDVKIGNFDKGKIEAQGVVIRDSRFLISLGLLDALLSLSAMVVEKKELDHRLILREHVLDYEESVTDGDRVLRVNSLKETRDIKHLGNLDLVQNSKVRWGIQADENSK